MQNVGCHQKKQMNQTELFTPSIIEASVETSPINLADYVLFILFNTVKLFLMRFHT